MQAKDFIKALTKAKDCDIMVIQSKDCRIRKAVADMKETSLKPVIEKLENLFSKFNEKFYNGELQARVITVSPDTTKGAYGWCTT